MNTAFSIRPPYTALNLTESISHWNTPLLPDLNVSRLPRSDERIIGTPIFTPPSPAVEKNTMNALRTASGAFLRSPSFIWEDVKSAPVISAGILVGMGVASYAGVMDTLSPWILIGGTVTATWMTVKGALGIQKGIRDGNEGSVKNAAREFGIGAFGLAITLATTGIMEGLEHFGIFMEDTDDQYGGFIRAMAAILHSPDEIALGVISVRKLLGQNQG